MYYVALCFNLCDDEYVFIVDKKAYQYAPIQNVLSDNKQQMWWYTAQMLGPFNTHEEACIVYNLWEKNGAKSHENLLLTGFWLKEMKNTDMWCDDPKNILTISSSKTERPMIVKELKMLQ